MILNSIWDYGGRVGGATLWEHIKTYHWGCQICQGYDTFSSLIFMFEYSNSFQTHRICCKQYLDSIWIVFGCRVCWGWGGGCQHRPDGPTTDPIGNFLSPQTWLHRGMKLPKRFYCKSDSYEICNKHRQWLDASICQIWSESNEIFHILPCKHGIPTYKNTVKLNLHILKNENF